MFEFFIALFGGIFYGNKYSKEKSSMIKADKRLEDIFIKRANLQKELEASNDLSDKIKNYIACGRNYDTICKELENEFKYIFGVKWKDILTIPPDCSCTFSLPSEHGYWVYHLLLAKQGKMDNWAILSGYPIGGIKDKDMNIKFAQCIEFVLNEQGKDIKLALELDKSLNITSSNPCGGDIKIFGQSPYPMCRLW